MFYLYGCSGGGLRFTDVARRKIIYEYNLYSTERDFLSPRRTRRNALLFPQTTYARNGSTMVFYKRTFASVPVLANRPSVVRWYDSRA